MKRIISYILVLCIVLGSTTLVYSEGTEGKKASAPEGTVVNGGNVIVENNNYLLDFNADKLWFQITDKRNGFVWGSNYLSNADDETALGTIKTDMMSTLVVTYAFNGTTESTNSFVSVVRKKNFTVRSIENGVRVDYNFKDLGFNIPVEYLLDDSGLKASILASEITENEINKVVGVELLPFFGSEQSKGADGYAFVPDGSGAIISLSKRKSGIVRLYEKRVYGEDLFTASTLQTTYEQDIKAPVFGIKCGENAVAAVIENGAETAFICASAPGQVVDGATVYSRYIHRANGNVDVTMQNGSKTSSLFMSDPDNDFVKYTVKYSFLTGDNANYVGMAKVYRDFLENNGLKDTSKGESVLYLSLYGGILKQSNFLGVPYKKVEALTTYADAKTILEKFKAKGVKNISLGLKNYTNSSIKGMAEIEFGLLSSLGGKKGYNSLVSYAENNNVSIYSYADFFSFSSSGNGMGGNSTKVYSLQKSPLRLKGFSLVDNYRVDSAATVSFVRPTKYQEATETLVKNASKAKVQGVALESIASSIISDYAKGYISRTDAKKMILTATDTINNKYSVITSSANDYMWKYSNSIVDLPTYSSKYIIFDYDVPFLQIALKGTKDYSTEALNLAGVTTESFLNAVEGCSNIKFDGIYADDSVINGTQLSDVFGANYKSWFDICVKWQTEMKKIYDAVKDSEIVAHSSNGDVALTVYKNGTRVYVNYSETEAELDGVKIPALWYTLKEGN